MLNRRTFCRQAAATLAGALVAGTGVGTAAMQSGSGRRRQVTVGGRRVKTIDVHSHCVVPGIMEMMGQKTPANPSLVMSTGRLPQMDEQGIDVEVLSINPFWYSVGDRELARSLIAAQNEKLAAFCSANAARFAGLATVALQHPDLAAEQLEAGMKMGLHGVSIGASVDGEELAAPRFDPFWAKAEALRAPIFIHPQGVPDLKRLQGNGLLTNVIGNPLDTTIALSHLIFEGTLDRFPGLRICAAHGGGYLPSYAARMDHGCLVFPNECKAPVLKRKPSEYLKQLYFDTLVFTGEALRHLVAEHGASQLVIGTDYAVPWVKGPVDHVLDTPGLSDDERIAILGGNAAKLIKLPT